MNGSAAEAVAVIGLACRVPGAADAAAFWDNLCREVEAVTRFTPAELAEAGVPEAVSSDPGYVPAAGWLDGLDEFDAALFGIPPREAAAMDPQHRLFLQSAWTALEDAGYLGAANGPRIGAFAGVSGSDWLLRLMHDRDLVRALGADQVRLGTEKDYLVSRVAYRLGLEGPAITVQTACSSSLVAVHLAVRSLLTYECDMALAGGVSVTLINRVGYWYEPGGVHSPDGYCRTFDASAAGTVSGNGVGLVVLKRLSEAVADGDTVHAVLRGSAVNNDGTARVGFTAPGVRGQAAVVSEALAVAGLHPDDIDYVEAHGTGTALGDRIELTALGEVFGARTGPPVLVGSVKPSIGHLDAAAGVVGLIKAVLAVRHGTVPATLHLRAPTPAADWVALGLAAADRTKPWPERGPGPRRAGVSSFGIGGTNVHVIVEQPPAMPAARPDTSGPEIVLASAADDAALGRLMGLLRPAPLARCLSDVAATTQLGRAALACRAAMVIDSPAGAPWIVGHAGRPGVAFLFPGQGAQHLGAGAGLYRAEPVFRKEVDACADLLSRWLPVDVRQVITGEVAADVTETWLAQPVLFVLGYALARQWAHWGIEPAVTVGHSIGEFVSACLACVLDLPDALRAVVERGRILQDTPPGAMIAIALSEAEVADWLAKTPDVGIAAINAADETVLAGPVGQIERLAADLAVAEVPARRVRTSRAFHSRLVEPAVELFTEVMAGFPLQAPRARYVSTVSGDLADAEHVTDPAYWGWQLRAPVRFASALATAAAIAGDPVFVELGPGTVLTGLARRACPGTTAVASLPHPGTRRGPGDDQTALLRAVATAWVNGVEVDWAAHRSDRTPARRVPLPTYPFSGERHWPASLSRAVSQAGLFEVAEAELPTPAAPPAAPAAVAAPALAPAPDALEYDEVTGFLVEVWRDLLGVPQVEPADNFFVLGGESLLGVRLIGRIRRRFDVQLSPAQLFGAPTLRQLAALISELRDGVPDQEVADLVGEILRLRKEG